MIEKTLLEPMQSKVVPNSPHYFCHQCIKAFVYYIKPYLKKIA